MHKVNPDQYQKLQVFTERNFDQIDQLSQLSFEQLHAIKTVAQVLPFRVNQHVINELIDWDNIPDDPIFQLTFPQRGMLAPDDFAAMSQLIENQSDKSDITTLAQIIRAKMNPHPSGQMELNRPCVQSDIINGIQHKYRETILFFPARGQTCHSYCTFCFRWAQFIGDKSLQFASNNVTALCNYLKSQPDLTDIIFTGGDPMVMKTEHIQSYVEPLLQPELDHIQNIRFGTKALTFWPYRFVNAPDADELLRLFERLVKAGKHVAIMAHFNHWRELETDITRQAIQRIRATGAVIRSQAPVLRHINDDADVWARLWKTQIQLGVIPYYMFVERDTGPKNYFEMPLVKTWQIYQKAIQQLSGLGRTVRGPSMSAAPGKVEVQGISEVHGEKVISLRFLQGRNPDWVHKPFFAKYDSNATWLDQLQPAFGEEQFFFEKEFRSMVNILKNPFG